MPLVKGKGQKAIRENFEIEEKLGKKKPKQAIAIALNEARKYGYKPKKEMEDKREMKRKK